VSVAETCGPDRYQMSIAAEASQLVADMPTVPLTGDSQLAVLTDSLQQTSCSPPVYVPPTKVCARRSLQCRSCHACVHVALRFEYEGGVP